MSSVDTRVVEMQFDNKAFGSGVKQSLSDLDTLKKGLKLEGATSGLDEVGKAAQKVDLKQIGKDADEAGSRINAMAIFARTAIATISYQIVRMGEDLAKSVTIDPVKAGLDSYAEQINATQIILANTKAKGTTLKDVTAVLAELQAYAQQTVYSFSDMTTNIGRFTAAGVALAPATAAIKGMANVAALSGASTEQMSSAMYQMSQALSAGVVHLQDWNSLSNANMGGQGMQEAIKETAKTLKDHGAAMDAAIKKHGDFRQSLSEGWLTSDIFTKAMGVMGGTLDQATGKFRAFSVEELKSQGYSAKAAASLHQLSQDALNSAVNIRTIPQLMAALKEEVAGAWASVFKVIFGDINQATTLFSAMHNVLENSLTGPINNLRDLLQGWADLGGRAKAIEAFKNVWEALGKILGPIKDAFQAIFPPATAKGLYDMTVAFDNFTKKLIPSAATMNKIGDTFAGVFAVIHIGVDLIKAFGSFIIELIGHFSTGTGGILTFTAAIGGFLIHLDYAITQGNIFGKFFDWLAPKIEAPIDALKRFVGVIDAMVKAVVGGKAMSDLLDRIHQNSQQVADAGSGIANAWDRVKTIFDAVWKAVEPILAKVGSGVKTVVGDIAHFISGISFGDVLGAAGIGGVLLLLKKVKDAIDKFKDAKTGSGIMGFFDPVKEAMEKLTGTLEGMQKALKATTLLEIAAAIVILTIAVSTLSKIDAGGLTKAVIALGVMMAELVGSMKLFDKATKDTGALKFDMLAAGLILFAAAIDILASAVKKLADLSWNDLSKGLTGTVVLLAAVAGTMRLMPEQSKMISSGAGILLIAEAIKVLATAVKNIADLSWGEMAQGLTGVAALLTSLALYSKFSDVNSIRDGASLLLIASAIKILASAMKDISSLSWNEIAKGLAGIAGGLVGVTAAMKLMPSGSVLKGAGILEVTAALKILASAMKDMGDLSWQDIGKAGASIAGGLTLIGVALKLIPASSVISATGLLVATAALKILADAMKNMGSMSWSEIGKSLVELAGSLLILVVALNALDASLPGSAALVVAAYALKVLADAMKVMGGMSWSDIAAALVELAGAMLILVVALNAMEVSLPGAAALIVAAEGLKVIAEVMKTIGSMSWSDIGAAIGGLAAMFAVLAVGGALSPLIGALAIALGLLAAGVALIGSAIKNAGEGINEFADGLTKLSKIDPQGLNNIKNAVQGLIDKLPYLATGVADAIGNFITEFSKRTPEMAKAAGAAAIAMADEVAKDAPRITDSFMRGITDALANVAKRAPELAKSGGDAIVAMLNGMATQIPRIAASASNLVTTFLGEIGKRAKEISDAGFKMVIQAMNGIADSIRQNSAQVKAAGTNIGSAILDGIFGGVNDKKKQGGIMSSISSLASQAISVAKNVLGIKSPSKVFQQIGQDLVAGFAIGINTDSQKVTDAAEKMSQDIIAAMQAADKQVQDSTDKLPQLTQKRDDDNRSLALAETRLKAAESARKKNTAAIQAARDAVIKAKETVDKDNADIAEQRDLLAQATDQRNRAAKASDMLTRQFDDELLSLKQLADGYNALGDQVKEAQKALDDLQKQRDSYAQSTTDQYDKLPSISKDTTLSDYESQLQKSITDTQTLSGELKQVRDLGLNDSVYKQLVSQGTDAIPFVQQLIDGGKAGVDLLNNMQDQLDSIAQTIGGTAADALYKAGIDTAQGLVDGLKASQESIHQQMEDIANDMTQRLKDTLGIHSPSTVMAEQGGFVAQGLIQGLNTSQDAVGTAASDLAGFVVSGFIGGMNAGIPSVTAAAQGVAEAALAAAKTALGVASPSKEFIKIGQWSSEGMAHGLENYSDVVANAASGVANTALEAMTKTISGLGDKIGDNVDLNPVITPVLDLSSVQKDAASLGTLLSAQSVSIDSAYLSATDASARYRANQLAMADPAVSGGVATQNVTFIQNNNSPKALSSADLYRQTNNQLSVAKGALSANA